MILLLFESLMLGIFFSDLMAGYEQTSRSLELKLKERKLNFKQLW